MGFSAEYQIQGTKTQRIWQLGNAVCPSIMADILKRWVAAIESVKGREAALGHLHQFGTKLPIVDDAHDLSLEHLMFIKEITDQGRLQYDHPLGLCLVAAGRGSTIPLKEIFEKWEQTFGNAPTASLLDLSLRALFWRKICSQH